MNVIIGREEKTRQDKTIQYKNIGLFDVGELSRAVNGVMQQWIEKQMDNGTTQLAEWNRKE